MRRTTGIAVILIALATAATPAFARYYGHHYGWSRGGYNYGGPHYNTDDFTNNSRQLVGTR
jgi:hypothetical protein